MKKVLVELTIETDADDAYLGEVLRRTFELLSAVVAALRTIGRKPAALRVVKMEVMAL